MDLPAWKMEAPDAHAAEAGRGGDVELQNGLPLREGEILNDLGVVETLRCSVLGAEVGNLGHLSNPISLPRGQLRLEKMNAAI